MRFAAPVVLQIAVSAGFLAAACARQPAVVASDVPRHVTSMVSASAVVEACPDARHMNAKAAAETINKLVEPCGKVPGGKAHFTATLVPGGKIELVSPDEVVPTCVLSHGLAHPVALTKPCRFDVQLEERKLDGSPAQR
jgi:hypothetical protein